MSQEKEDSHNVYKKEQAMLLTQMEEEKNTQIRKFEEERKTLFALRMQIKETEKKTADEKLAYEKKTLENDNKLSTVTETIEIKENEIGRLKTENNKVTLRLKESIAQSEKMIEKLKLEAKLVLEEKQALGMTLSETQNKSQLALTDMRALLKKKEKEQKDLNHTFETYKTKSHQETKTNKQEQEAILLEIKKEKEVQNRKLEEERRALSVLRVELKKVERNSADKKLENEKTLNAVTKTIALKENEINTLTDEMTQIGDKAMQELKVLEGQIKTLHTEKDKIEEQLQLEVTHKQNILKEQEKFANETLLVNEKVKQLELSNHKYEQSVGNLEDINTQKSKALSELSLELESVQKLYDETLAIGEEERESLDTKLNDYKQEANEKVSALNVDIDNRNVELAKLKEMKEKGESEIASLREMFQTQLDINEQNIIKFKEKLESEQKTIAKLKKSKEYIHKPTLNREVLNLLDKGVKKKKIAKKFDLSVMDIDFIIALKKG